MLEAAAANHTRCIVSDRREHAGAWNANPGGRVARPHQPAQPQQKCISRGIQARHVDARTRTLYQPPQPCRIAMVVTVADGLWNQGCLCRKRKLGMCTS